MSTIAKLKSRIGTKSPHPLYIPKDLIREGFKGDVELLADAKTVTILHPKASLNEIALSLELVLNDINLRRGLKTTITTDSISQQRKTKGEKQ